MNKNLEDKKKALLANIEKNIEKYGRNFPWKAWLPQNTEQLVTNKSQEDTYKCVGKPKTVFSGRFVAVSGFIYAIVDGKYSVLANLRGEGTPDYKNHWNAVCGFLECFENSKEGIQREIFEECGFIINTEDLNIVHVETEPEECNNGNVTIRHRAFLGKIIPQYVTREGGEKDEVASVKWIPVDEIDRYPWAFNHLKTIKQYAPSKFMRKLIEFYYNQFHNYNLMYTNSDDIQKKDYE
jgi:ADP-ribose pyrophosphatase YjhB (NUDIX family)